MDVRRALGNWIRSRKDVLMPKWLRGVARLIMKGDQKVKKKKRLFSLTHCILGNFACFFYLLMFFKFNFFEKFFHEYHQSVKNLDPDQAQHFVGPDLGPKCLQKLPADDTCKQRVKEKIDWE